ncbi:MAG: TolC family protein [Spirochaetaceae bacterium]|nr:MAG: TolC family protein [Spirochaetaceae bacterium]
MRRDYPRKPLRVAVRTLFFVILGAGAAVVAGADSPEPSPATTITLTLEDAVSRARADDERLAAAVLESRRSEAAYRSARAERFPSLLLGTGYDRVRETDPPALGLPPELGGEITLGDSVADRINLHAHLRQEIFSGFRRTAQVAVMDHRLEASRYQQEFVAGQVEMAAVELYLNAVGAAERVQVAERALERASRVREDMENLLGEGFVTANDLLRARMAEAQAESALARIRNGRERTMLRLKRALGIDPETAVLLDHTHGGQQRVLPGAGPGAVPGAEAVEATISRAGGERADLLVIEQEILAAGQSVRVAEAGLYPTANLIAGARYARPSPVAFPQVAEFDYTWSVGFELTFNVGILPLVRSRAEEARLREQALRVERSRLGRDVALQVRAAALDIADAAEQGAAADLFVEQATENLRALETMHAEGLIRLSEVIEAQELLEQAEMNLLEATIDRELAEARYRFVSGGSALR